jgi:hypothetical protein
MKNATIFCLCLHDTVLPVVEKLNYIPVGLGSNDFSKKWLRDNTLENISFKNKYYGEYSFHYWFWKNMLPKIQDNHWIGFCAYREFWGNKKKITNETKIEDVVLEKIPEEWNKFDTILGNNRYINNLKLSKFLKHGIVSLIRNPSALIKSKRNIRFHFDMWHGNGNLDKAIDLLDNKDREDFRRYTRQNISFATGNMFFCRSKDIINNYYESVFPWLEKCEKIFGFNLKNYGLTRIYAFLAERYLSYWFNKYTKPLQWPIVYYDVTKNNI